MRSCWNFMPEDRPNFTALGQSIKQLLQLQKPELHKNTSDSYLKVF